MEAFFYILCKNIKNMRSPKVWSRSEVWKGSNSTWSRTHHRSFKYSPAGDDKKDV